MSLVIKGKAAHIAPRRRQSQPASQQSQPAEPRTDEQSSRKTSTAESMDHEANEITNLADQYAQSLQQHIQILQIENSFLKKQQDEREFLVQQEREEKHRQEQCEEQLRRQKLHEDQQRKEYELQQRRESSRRDRRGPATTQILARGNEVSLNGETWCQLPPDHPPIPAIISDRSQYSHRGGRERSFYSDDYSSYVRDRREYSVPCISRHRNSRRERSFVTSHNIEQEEILVGELEDAIQKNTDLEREIAMLKSREREHEEIISSLKLRIKTIETEKKGENDVLVNEKKALLEELLDMQKRIDELAPACAEKELKIVATDNEKLDLTKRLRHANSDISHLQANILHLREDIINRDDKIKTLNDEIQYMQSRILVIEGETRELRIREDTNQEKLTAYHQQVREYELTKINDKKLIDKVMEENANLIKDNAKISTKLNRLEHVDFSIKQKEMKEAQATTETVSELRSALQTERSSSHSLMSKIEIMRQRYDDLEKTISERDKTEEENIAERSRVEKELNALHALSKSLSSENKVLREEKLMNEEIIDELKGKIRALEENIRTSQNINLTSRKAMGDRIKELEDEIRKKHQKFLEFEEIANNLHQITSVLPSKLSDMTQKSVLRSLNQPKDDSGRGYGGP